MSNPKRKSPAFLLFADDFLAGTAEMSAEEVGGYIRLLCHQWTKGSIPNDEERARRMAGLMGSPSLGYVLAKFSLCEDGNLRNARLESVRSERDQFVIKQAENGRKGALKRWGNGDPNGDPNGTAIATPLATHCPKDDSPSPSPSPSKPTVDSAPSVAKRFTPPTIEECRAMAVASGLPESEGDKFWHHYTANGWKVGSAKMKSAESAMYMWASRKKEGKYDDNRNGAGRHGQLTPAERRNAVIAGADAIQQQAIRTAQREAEMVARGELPL